MSTATAQLVKDHKMIRKLLAELAEDHPRYPQLLVTTERVVLGHAWFEDEFLLPALKARPGLFQPFREEIAQEHRDIAGLFLRLRGATPSDPVVRPHLLTLRVLLETHFAKEEDALFPLAEKIIGEEGLVGMAVDMERRKSEVRLPPA
ncbi:MAG TPA: hemerythrin domain-containing protein [Elusimicrobiota bacterium]|nr:hemerythrin domain-containing protein [Elusimicrobiota bacterium]